MHVVSLPFISLHCSVLVILSKVSGIWHSELASTHRTAQYYINPRPLEMYVVWGYLRHKEILSHFIMKINLYRSNAYTYLFKWNYIQMLPRFSLARYSNSFTILSDSWSVSSLFNFQTLASINIIDKKIFLYTFVFAYVSIIETKKCL